MPGATSTTNLARGNSRALSELKGDLMQTQQNNSTAQNNNQSRKQLRLPQKTVELASESTMSTIQIMDSQISTLASSKLASELAETTVNNNSSLTKPSSISI